MLSEYDLGVFVACRITCIILHCSAWHHSGHTTFFVFRSDQLLLYDIHVLLYRMFVFL